MSKTSKYALSEYGVGEIQDAIEKIVTTITDATVGKVACDGTKRLGKNPNPKAMEDVQGTIHGLPLHAARLAIQLTEFVDELHAEAVKWAEGDGQRVERAFGSSASGEGDDDEGADPPDAA